MTPDVSPTAPTNPWKKAIPEARDRLQSKILVWIAVSLLCYACYTTVMQVFIAADGRFRKDLLYAIAVSFFFALIAWRLKSATPSAAICGGMICLLTTLAFGTSSEASIFHSGLTPLILLFLVTREATRLGRDCKESAGIAESRQGRNAAQILANLGVAGVIASFWARWIVAWAFGGTWAGDGQSYFALFQVPMLAALAEATADTVSSEVGQVFGGRPFLLTTLRRVAPGTDGAISLRGTLSGIGGALLIALVGKPALGMDWAECAVVFGSAVFGLFIDSLLGATVERKGWLGNDLVNLLSTASAAGCSVLLIRYWGGDLLLCL